MKRVWNPDTEEWDWAPDDPAPANSYPDESRHNSMPTPTVAPHDPLADLPAEESPAAPVRAPILQTPTVAPAPVIQTHDPNADLPPQESPAAPSHNPMDTPLPPLSLPAQSSVDEGPPNYASAPTLPPLPALPPQSSIDEGPPNYSSAPPITLPPQSSIDEGPPNYAPARTSSTSASTTGQVSSRTKAQEPDTGLRLPFAGDYGISTYFNEKDPKLWARAEGHPGIDYKTPVGTPVLAAGSGTVTAVGIDGNYGRRIIVRHAGGVDTIYGHLLSAAVKVGDTVTAGEPIGRSGGAPGSSGAGLSTGPHLHFETRQNGQIVDPGTLMSKSGTAPAAAPAAATNPATAALVAEARSAAQKAGIDPDIFVRQIDAESHFDPNAKSPAGARGIAQIVPEYHPNAKPDDPKAALGYAAKLMASLLKKYDGDYAKALAAYNAGPAAVDRAGGVPNIPETQAYVRKILDGGTSLPETAPPPPQPGILDAIGSGLAGAAGSAAGLVGQGIDRATQGAQGLATGAGALAASAAGELTALPSAAVDRFGRGVQAAEQIPGILGNALPGLPLSGGPGRDLSIAPQTLGQNLTSLSQGVVQPVAALNSTLERLSAAESDGDQQQFHDQLVELSNGLGRSGMTPVEFFQSVYQQGNLTPAAQAIELLADPGNLLLGGLGELAGPLVQAAKRVVPGAARAAQRALPGAIELPGGSVARRGSLDLSALGGGDAGAAGFEQRYRDAERAYLDANAQYTAGTLSGAEVDAANQAARALNEEGQRLGYTDAQLRDINVQVHQEWEQAAAARAAETGAPFAQAPGTAEHGVMDAQAAAETASATEQERGLVTHLKDSPFTTPVLRQLLDDAAITYEPITNTETFAAASRRVDASPEATLTRVLDPSTRHTVDTEAEALVLLRRAAESGDGATMRDITKAIAPEVTDAAQRLQLLSKLDELSPEGLFLAGQRMINKAIARGQGPEVARRMEQQAAALRYDKEMRPFQDELNAVREELVTAQKQVDEWRRLAQAKEKAAKTGKIAVHDVLAEVRGLFEEEDLYVPLPTGSRSETLGMSIGLPTPGNRAPKAVELTMKEAAVYRQRAEAIKAMAEGAERDAAKQALYDELQGRAKPPAPTPQPLTPAQQQQQEERYFREQAQGAAREARQERTAGANPADQRVQNALGKAQDQQFSELNPPAPKPPARTPADRAAERVAQQAAKQRAKDLAALIDGAAKPGTVRLLGADRAAIQQVKALLTRIGETLPEDVANDFLDRAGGLAGLTGEERANGIRSLVSDLKQMDPVQQALAERKAQQETAAAVRRQAQQQANDLSTLIDAASRNVPRTMPLDRKAVAQAKAVLTKYGAEMDEAQAQDFLQRAKDLPNLPPPQQGPAFKALLEDVHQLDPVQQAAAQRAKLLEEARALRQRAKDRVDLVNAAAYQSEQRVTQMHRELIKTAKQRLRDADVNMPAELADSFLDRVNALKGMPEKEQFYAARDLMEDVRRLFPASKVDAVLSAWNLPRALKATWDLSYPLRQGIVLGAGHPKVWADMFVSNIRTFMSEDVARAADEAVLFGPLSKARLEAGVEWVDRNAASIAKREETYMTKWAGKVPLTARSERAYVTSGNKQRADVWDSVVRGWLPDEMKGNSFTTLDELVKATGKSQEDFERLASFVNAATGRGNMPDLLKRSSGWLNAAFFAPRFTLSRVQVPYYTAKYTVQNPALRGEMAKGLVGFVAANGMMLALADQIPGVDVNWDPYSTDFAKIRVGNQRIDIWGGFLPLVGLVVKLATGKHRTEGGRLMDVSRWDALGGFVRGKLSPGAAFINDIRLGQTMGGEPMRSKEDIAGAIVSQVVPFLAEDIHKAWQEDGTRGATIAAGASFFGAGTNSYSSVQNVRDKEARTKYGTIWSDLPKSQREDIDALPTVQSKLAEADARTIISDSDRVAVARESYDTAKQRIEGDMRQHLDAGMPDGPALWDQVSRMKAARYEAGQTAYNAMVETAMQKGQPDQALKDVLKEQYWAAQPTEDLATGKLDFKVQEQQRADVLKRAREAGIQESYILDRGKRFDDPKVKAAVERVEAAQEALRPYWEVGNRIDALMPAYAALKKQYDEAQRNQDQVTVKRIEDSPVWDQRNRDIQTAQDGLRKKDPAIEQALVIWKNRQPGDKTSAEQLRDLVAQALPDMDGQRHPYRELVDPTQADINAYIDRLNKASKQLTGQEITKIDLQGPDAKKVFAAVGAPQARVVVKRPDILIPPSATPESVTLPEQRSSPYADVPYRSTLPELRDLVATAQTTLRGEKGERYQQYNEMTRQDIDAYIAQLQKVARQRFGKDFLQLDVRGPEAAQVFQQMGAPALRRPLLATRAELELQQAGARP